MKNARQLRAPQFVTELVGAGYQLTVVAQTPKSAEVYPMSASGEPGTPITIDSTGMFISPMSDTAVGWHIRALTGDTVYYVVEKARPMTFNGPGLIVIDNVPKIVPDE